MKKFYTIASALMLAMSMTMMTACSSENDPVIDEPVVPEQPTTRIVTLKATADMGAETRVAVEGIDGKEDAFRITGWKDGEEVKVFAFAYNEEYPWESFKKEIAFAYDASKDVFTGEVPSNIELSDLKYAYVGGSVGDVITDPYGNLGIMNINIPIAITNPEDCFLFGNVSVDDESISANLSAPYALACVHNNTASDIVVGQIAQTNMYCWEGLSYEYESSKSSFTLQSGYTSVVANAAKFTVPAHDKVYFVIPPKNVSDNVWYGLYDFTYERVIAAPKENVTLGKVYKVQVNPFGTGKAEATIGDNQVDVKWVQLWAGGPKFAEYNLGASSIGEIGGYYSDPDETDPATQLWGSYWRTPTYDDVNPIEDNCDVEYTTDYNGTGVAGYIVTGKDDFSANSVFFPQTGYYDKNGVYSDIEPSVRYWTTTLQRNDGNRNVFFIDFSVVPFDPSISVWINAMWTKYRLPVRAVLAE